MVNGGGGQQDPIVERLIRLEVEIKASNERAAAEMAAYNRRIDDTNQRIAENVNLLMEVIRETNRETNQRITDLARQNAEGSKEINDRIDRLEVRVDSMIGRIDKLFYVMIGVGTAVIATLVAGQIAG